MKNKQYTSTLFQEQEISELCINPLPILIANVCTVQILLNGGFVGRGINKTCLFMFTLYTVYNRKHVSCKYYICSYGNQSIYILYLLIES